MKTGIVNVSRLFSVAIVALILSACTTKGTIKATTDPTTDILSSTSGKTWFTEEGLVRDDYRIIAFATINFENLKDEMAQGRGEYLTSLGSLLGVAKDRQAEFSAWTQDRYPLLVGTDRTTPNEMLASLNRQMVAFRAPLVR
jgi:hypothetical protein